MHSIMPDRAQRPQALPPAGKGLRVLRFLSASTPQYLSTSSGDQTWPAFSRAAQQVLISRRVTTYGSTFAFGRRSSM